MKNIAVILSGCGVKDGSEIHEATLLLLAIDKLGAKYTIFAPNKPFKAVNHCTNGEEESRNVLTEAARIARGNIYDLSSFDAKNFDAIILPGGFGAAKNLSDYAFNGAKMTTDHDVNRAIINMHSMHKPIGALCIAPVVVANVLKNGVKVTIGNDSSTIKDIEAMGATHELAGATDVVVDTEKNVHTTPCYMLASKISEVYDGIEKLVKSVLNSL